MAYLLTPLSLLVVMLVVVVELLGNVESSTGIESMCDI